MTMLPQNNTNVISGISIETGLSEVWTYTQAESPKMFRNGLFERQWHMFLRAVDVRMGSQNWPHTHFGTWTSTDGFAVVRYAPPGRPPVDLSEPVEAFPSDELISKVIALL